MGIICPTQFSRYRIPVRPTTPEKKIKSSYIITLRQDGKGP